QIPENADEQLRQLFSMAHQRMQSLNPEGGTGGDIGLDSLNVWQTGYVDSMCPVDGDPETEGVQASNVVFIFWSEPAATNSQIEIFIDDSLDPVAVVDPLPPPEEQEARLNGLLLTGVPAGVHTFLVEETDQGTFDEIELDVLDVQPFGDPTNVQCVEGLTGEDDAGEEFCTMRLAYANSGPQPTTIEMFFGGGNPLNMGNFLGTITNDGGFFIQTIVTITYGPATFALPTELAWTLVGAENYAPDGGEGSFRARYLGCFMDNLSDCQLDCEDPDCDPPFQIWEAQYGYENNEMLALWICGGSGACPATYPDGVRMFDTGAEIGVIQPADSLAFLAGGGDGAHTFGLQGLCDVANLFESELIEKPFDLLPETPYSPIVEGSLTQEFGDFDFDDGQGGVVGGLGVRSTWTNSERSHLMFIWEGNAVDGVNTIAAIIPSGLPGEEQEYIHPVTSDETIVELQFLRYFSTIGDAEDPARLTLDQAFGSERFTTAEPPPPADFFVRGNIDGSADPAPQITDAIYLLSFLFLGGPPPPCAAAADTDATGGTNLTDAVYVLTFLFLGGAAPPTWIDGPTCEAFVDGVVGFDLGCETPWEGSCVADGDPAAAP
ncbi:MAG: hypothetical protein AAF488_17450, partial [Planctomycetota bacterium]